MLNRIPDKDFRGKFAILKSIYVAVKNVGENAKKLLDDELIKNLGQMSYNLIFARFRGQNYETQADYEACKEILKFKESISAK